MIKALSPDRGPKHRTEAIPPEPHRLVADVDTSLEQNILDLPQRKRIADIIITTKRITSGELLK